MASLILNQTIPMAGRAIPANWSRTVNIHLCVCRFDSCRSAHHQTNTSSTMEKEPIFTKCVSAGTRVYYMDAHSDKKGQPYISISEVPTRRNPGKKERRRIFVHLEDIPKFAEAFAEVAKYITDNTKDGTLALCN